MKIEEMPDPISVPETRPLLVITAGEFRHGYVRCQTNAHGRLDAFRQSYQLVRVNQDGTMTVVDPMPSPVEHREA